MAYLKEIKFPDSPNFDAFGKLRVSEGITMFESSFIYDLQPLLYQQTVTGTGSITHDSTNSAAVLSTTGAGTGFAEMLSYVRPRYQPGKSHSHQQTFAHGTVTANKQGRYGLYDPAVGNGFYLYINGTAISFERGSSTSEGNLSVPRASWNLDKMDGTGPSKVTIDFSKAQILCMDFEWLGVGRVRVGFNVDGMTYYAHEFLHANSVTNPYIKALVLPVYANLQTTAAIVASSRFFCASVQSEGGINDVAGYNFSVGGTVSAGSGTRTAIMSLRPRTTFNSVVNRMQFELTDISLASLGTNSIIWELIVGATFSVAPTWANVDATYSGTEYTSAPGTYSAGTGIAIASGLIPAGTMFSGARSIEAAIKNLYPITLDRAGAQRALGTMTLVVSGISGASTTFARLNWKEVR